MSDLLDLLTELDESTTPVYHALMPWMAPACGTVSACGGNCGGGCPPQSPRHRFTTTYADVDCPACLSAGDLHQMARDSQRPGRMAVVEG